MNKINFMILAGGDGTRFGTSPKVLIDLGGRTCLEEIIALTGDHDTIVITKDYIKDRMFNMQLKNNIEIVIQENATGTSEAFQLGLNKLKSGHVFVLFGDSPLTSLDTIEQAISKIENQDIVFSAFHSSNLFNTYGRVIPGKPNRILEISEHPEPSELYNGGWMLFNQNFISRIRQIQINSNFLTKYLEFSSSSFILVPEEEALGINTPSDYQVVKSIINRRRVFNLIKNGVQVLDPSTITLSYESEIGAGSILEPNLFFGPKVKVGKSSTIKSNTVLENVTSGDHCTLGPFGYLHDVIMGDHCHLGAFCEVTRSTIGNQTKAKHLVYLGDVSIGNRVNIGAGSVFCNYDGQRKQACIVEDNAFLGSNCSFVAPVKIGEGAYIGASTAVRRDIDPGSLYVANPNYMEYKK